MNNWLAIGNHHSITCCTCKVEVHGVGDLDHHIRICLACKVECLFYSHHTYVVQIVLQKAPLPLQKFIEWAQKELDELDFAELIGAIEEIQAAVDSK